MAVFMSVWAPHGSFHFSCGSHMAVSIAVLGPILQFPLQFWVPYCSFHCSFGSHIAVSIAVLDSTLQFPWQFWVPCGSCHFSFGSHIAVVISVLGPIWQLAHIPCIPRIAQMMRHGPFETVVASWLLPSLGSPLYIGHPLGVLALESLEKSTSATRREEPCPAEGREVEKGGR